MTPRLRLATAALAALLALGLVAVAGAAPAGLSIAPVTRLPFPERGFVVSLPDEAAAQSITVRENGAPVAGVRVEPLAGSGLRSGVVLALDSSESMAGAPARAALDSARAFVAQRSENGQIGIVAFNGELSILSELTADEAALRRTLSTPPKLAYGTRIHDAVTSSLALLQRGRISSGAVVVLSDGADIGSTKSLEAAIAAAKAQQVRVFAVGLRSGAFRAAPLRALAEQTGGSFAEARSTAELAPIYAALGRRLASEYLVRYRSPARPMSQVDVVVAVEGTGTVSTTYVAPTPSLLPPYHRSFLSRFLLSPSSPLVIGLLFGALVCLLLVALVRRPRATVVQRVQSFSGGRQGDRRARTPEAVAPKPVRKRYAGGWWAALERDLELARMDATPRQVVGVALGGTLICFLAALLVGVPVLAVVGLTSPLAAHMYVRRKVKAVQSTFADQFPGSLQVLASALRAGHSFNGALGVVVDNAAEPARSELARVMNDERLGVLPEDAIRKLARRMQNRDIEQVALLAELQRTTGGNSAEILDTVVSTIRERAELRRLVRTLTAQGRMARWILTALPIFLTAFLFITHTEMMVAFFTSPGGQAAVVFAAMMVAAGSFVIQRIVDIDV